MAIGWKNVELDVDFEKEEVINGASYTIPVDNRSVESDQNSPNNLIATLLTLLFLLNLKSQTRLKLLFQHWFF